MLRVADGCKELARYVGACLWLADRACVVVCDADCPLDAASIAQRLDTDPAVLTDVLDCDYRFRLTSSDQFELLLWERQGETEHAPILTTMYNYLYWRGLPATTEQILIEVNVRDQQRRDARKLHRLLDARPAFVKRSDKWLLSQWLQGDLQLDPGYFLLAVGCPTSEIEPSPSPVDDAYELLRAIGCVVPFDRLWWELGLSPSPIAARTEPAALARGLLESDAVAWLRGGHVAHLAWVYGAHEWLLTLAASKRRELREMLLERFIAHLGDSDDLSRWLASVKRAAAASALAHLSRLQPPIAAVEDLFRRRSVEDELIVAVQELDRGLPETNEGKTLIARLIAETEGHVREALRRAGCVALPGNRLALVSRESLERLASALLEPITGLSDDELLRHLGLSGDTSTLPVQSLAPALLEFDLQQTEGFWHPARDAMRPAIRAAAVDLAAALAEARGPVAELTLPQRANVVSSDCPEPVLAVVIEELERQLRNNGAVWVLDNGDYWVTPELLAGPERVRELRGVDVEGGRGLPEALPAVLGLRLDALSEAERSQVVEAFRQQLARAPITDPTPGAELETAEWDEPPPSPPVSAPPARSEVTLTDGMLRRRYLRFTGGARRIFRACLAVPISDRVTTEVTVEGSYGIEVELDFRGGWIRGDRLFRWLNEIGAAAGDRVVIYAPVSPGTRPQVALESALAPAATSGPGSRWGMQLLDRVFEALATGGRVMRVEEIAQHVSRTLETSAAESSIAATLSGNSHVFASWGRAL